MQLVLWPQCRCVLEGDPSVIGAAVREIYENMALIWEWIDDQLEEDVAEEVMARQVSAGLSLSQSAIRPLLHLSNYVDVEARQNSLS
jgi:hypothetical protein